MTGEAHMKQTSASASSLGLGPTASLPLETEAGGAVSVVAGACGGLVGVVLEARCCRPRAFACPLPRPRFPRRGAFGNLPVMALDSPMLLVGILKPVHGAIRSVLTRLEGTIAWELGGNSVTNGFKGELNGRCRISDCSRIRIGVYN